MVVADSRAPRDGKFIDIIGTYNPLTDPAQINIDAEKANKWLKNGATQLIQQESSCKKWNN